MWGSRSASPALADDPVPAYYICVERTGRFCNVENGTRRCTTDCASCTMCNTNPGLLTLRKCGPSESPGQCAYDPHGVVFCGLIEQGECGPGCSAGWATCHLNGTLGSPCNNTGHDC